ncbi:hypothetical protein [Brucella pituitosa]|uniref:hypothetical protein n=1 Tax=Brucella pituitosa TaxID=571256 RepID=UPI0026B050AD
MLRQDRRTTSGLRIPDGQAAWRGILGMAMNGVVGTIALLAAFLIRIRSFRAFGEWLCRGCFWAQGSV